MTQRAVAVLLAAGESTRMGRIKQLLPWAGTTLIAWQIEQLSEAGVQEIVVILGAAAGEVGGAVVHPSAHAVFNPDYREGRASSLRTGAAAIPTPPDWVVILGVDQPRPSWVTRRLLAAGSRQAADTGAPPTPNAPKVGAPFAAGGSVLALVPTFGDHRSHPVLLAGVLLEELCRVDEASLGLRAVMERHATETLVIPVTAGPASCDIDLNTPADYERALASFERDGWPPSA